MPPAPDRSRTQPARPAPRPPAPNPANLYVSPGALWAGVAVIALLTIVSFEVGYLLGKPRGERPRPEVAAAPPATPEPKPKAAPAAKPPGEPAPSSSKPAAKPQRQDAAAAPKSGPPPKFTFAADVLPVFQSKCVSCHGGFKPKGKLDVRTLEAVARGGNEGPSIMPGSPEVSPLWTWVASGQMPPKGKPQLT